MAAGVPAAAAPDDLRTQLDQARARLDALDVAASTAVEDADEAAVVLATTEHELAGLQARLDDLGAQADKRQQAANRYAASLYKSGGGLQLAAAFGASGPTEAGRRLATVTRLRRNAEAALEALVADRITIEAVQDRLTERRQAAASHRRDLAAKRDRVLRLLDEQRGEVRDLQARIAELERREAQEQAARARAAAQRQAEAEDARPAPQPAPAPQPSSPPPPAPTGSARDGARTAVDAAMSQVGKPYEWGGSGPDSYDCSGLTSWAWRHAGVSLPHSSRAQFSATTRIARSQLSLGDLIFFGSPIHHVAMYIGDGRVVEAPYSGSSVRVNSRALSRSDITGYGRP